MPECEARDCSLEARHTVTFEDPSEEVGYCLSHAMTKYRLDSTAVAVKEGV